jgi:hypothetical protein
LIVSLHNFPTELAFLGKDRHLFDQNSHLKGIQTAVDPHQGMLVFDFLTMYPNLQHFVRQSIVIRKNGPAVPITPERLGREKRRAAYG